MAACRRSRVSRSTRLRRRGPAPRGARARRPSPAATGAASAPGRGRPARAVDQRARRAAGSSCTSSARCGDPVCTGCATGSRVADAVARAGGATRSADLGGINLAAPLVDGTQVLVPRRRPVATPRVAGGLRGRPRHVRSDAGAGRKLEPLDGDGERSSTRSPGWGLSPRRRSSTTGPSTAHSGRSTTSTRCPGSGRRGSSSCATS